VNRDLVPNSAYIGGPISSRPDGNSPAFKLAADILRNEGVWAWSPREQSWSEEVRLEALELGAGYTSGPKYQEGLRRCLVAMLSCEVVYMLRDWRLSRGARDEAYLATRCGLELRCWHPEPDQRIRIRPGLVLTANNATAPRV
jgi:hypothetical protein